MYCCEICSIGDSTFISSISQSSLFCFSWITLFHLVVCKRPKSESVSTPDKETGLWMKFQSPDRNFESLTSIVNFICSQLILTLHLQLHLGAKTSGTDKVISHHYVYEQVSSNQNNDVHNEINSTVIVLQNGQIFNDMFLHILPLNKQ